jgi:anti-sigma28 factor (negative regulator of flagellin synthesis)
LNPTPEFAAPHPFPPAQASSADVRADRIAALRQSISAGTYYIPASAVAAKMLSLFMN